VAMAESASHIRLVSAIVRWLTYGPLSVEEGLILIDCPEQASHSKPRQLGRYIPDVHVPAFGGRGPIIGEAKTVRDLERGHTSDQLAAFLKWCGQNDDSLFIIAVPWHMARLAEAVLRRIQLSTGTEHVRTRVLDRLSG